MKIVIAPDKFKDSLSAAGVCAAIAEGFRRAIPAVEIDACPMADGGEGTVEALVANTGGRVETCRVNGPLPRMLVDAPIGITGDGTTAIIEMSSASGLFLLAREQRNPALTTTFGTGELLRHAADLGVRKIILGIGGSATTDGGAGCAHAWGARFELDGGQATRPTTGGDLARIRAITSQLPLDTRGIEITVACDVSNPLLGPNGAAAIFGPQKGATPAQVVELEAGLARLVQLTGRQDLADRPGAGAAGGLGFGMLAFFNATLRPGVDIVADAVRLCDRLQGADLCITGEGRLDAQSLSGKTAVGVARICKAQGVPCIALVGSVGDGANRARAEGLLAHFSIASGPMALDYAMSHAAELLTATAENVAWLRRPDAARGG
jgi:glycerate kinase